MNTLYDTILWLASKGSGKRFPIVQFSADTDMATDGWISLTSTEHSEVVVVQMTGEEIQSERAAALVEARVNKRLGRHDLKHVPLVRVEDSGPSSQGVTFQQFLKVRKPPKLFYQDIFDPKSEAEEVSRESRAQFESAGGRVVVLT